MAGLQHDEAPAPGHTSGQHTAVCTPGTPARELQAEILGQPSTVERRMANAVRALAIDAVEAARSGHPGMPLGMADAATALWSRVLRFDAADPNWPDRDRFVLSAGHGSMLLYALLHLTGHAGMDLEALRRFRQIDSPAAGHPEHGEHPAIETTTGPLGQGLATAIGMALAERMLAARFGRSLVDHRTWVIASDGDLMEGISHEAACLAGHLRLEKLTVLWDDNSISIDGETALSQSDDVLKRFAAAGWATTRVDGHRPAASRRRALLRRPLQKTDPHRLPHHHRLRRPDESRHRRLPRQPARPHGSRRRQGRARLATPPLRNPARPRRTLGARRRPRHRRPDAPGSSASTTTPSAPSSSASSPAASPNPGTKPPHN